MNLCEGWRRICRKSLIGFFEMALLIHDVPIECINYAAATYHVPATMIISVLETEGGKNGEANKNKNGSLDYGPMQINSCWLQEVSRYGVTKHELQYNPCVNVTVGTWILAQSIASGKNVWHGVGSYHSRTKVFNERYREKVKDVYGWLTSLIGVKKRSPNGKDLELLTEISR